MTKPLLMLIVGEPHQPEPAAAKCRSANNLDAKSRIIVAERSSEDQANALT